MPRIGNEEPDADYEAIPGLIPNNLHSIQKTHKARGKSTKQKEVISDIATKAADSVSWYTASLIDTLALIAWVFTQWLVAQFLEKYKLEGMDKTLEIALQIMIAFPTLIPLSLHIYRDIRIMWIRTQRDIRTEKGKDNGKRS